MSDSTKLALPGGLNLWHLILLGIMVVQAVFALNSRDNMMISFKTHTEDFEKEVTKEIKALHEEQARLAEQSSSLDVVKNELQHVREDIKNLTSKVDLLVERKR